MSILVNTGFKVGSAEPLNEYSIRETVDDRDALVTDGYVYEGMEVYCKDTKVKYIWTGTDWEEVGTGGTVDLSGYAKTYTSLTDLGLTADATLQDVINAMFKGSSALLGVKEFTNYQTMFPYEEGNDQFARVHIVKGIADGSCMYARWFRKDGVKEAIAIFNINDNTFSRWQILKNRQTYISLAELGLTADATVEDVVSTLKNGESFLAPVNTFTNYETIFPNKVPNDQWNKIHIIKGTSLANSHIRCYSQSGACEYLANVNNTNITGWNDVSGTYIDISEAIIEKLGNEILKYPVGKYRINSNAMGNKFTDLPSDVKAKSGLIEVNGTAVGKSPFTDTWVYRMYKFECLSGTSSYVRRLDSGATAGQIEHDTGWCKEGQTCTSLTELGLTAPVSIGEVFLAMPDKTTLMLNVENINNADATVTDAPHNQGVLVINKHTSARFSIEFNYSLGGNGNTIRKWIGTLKGIDGTGLNWKEVAYSNDYGIKSYYSITDLGLDTTATINDIIGAMVNASMFIYKTDVFDYATEYENLQYATVTIYKHSAGRIQALMTDKYTGDLYIGKLNGNNQIVGWVKIPSDTRVTTLETQVNELFQSVSNGKKAVANAITGKGVSTSTTATFATMATNIGKISSYKEETKSYNNTSNGINPIEITFSANVLGIKRIVTPSDSCQLIAQNTADMFRIENKTVTMYINGRGTWKITAIIQA